jgi:hypothetical protein
MQICWSDDEVCANVLWRFNGLRPGPTCHALNEIEIQTL